MHAAKIMLYRQLIQRLAARTMPTKEESMTETDTTTVAPTPMDQAQTGTPPSTPAQTDPVCATTTTEAADANSAAPAPLSDLTQTPVQSPQNSSVENSPFIKTALAAATLIEQLRQHPESIAFLQALLRCLEPQPSNPPQDPG